MLLSPHQPWSQRTQAPAEQGRHSTHPSSTAAAQADARCTLNPVICAHPQPLQVPLSSPCTAAAASHGHTHSMATARRMLLPARYCEHAIAQQHLQPTNTKSSMAIAYCLLLPARCRPPPPLPPPYPTTTTRTTTTHQHQALLPPPAGPLPALASSAPAGRCTCTRTSCAPVTAPLRPWWSGTLTLWAGPCSSPPQVRGRRAARLSPAALPGDPCCIAGLHCSCARYLCCCPAGAYALLVVASELCAYGTMQHMGRRTPHAARMCAHMLHRQRSLHSASMRCPQQQVPP